jgi:hypothetical protein
MSINVTIPTAAELIEGWNKDVRGGTEYNTEHGKLNFAGGRFYLAGKRIAAGEAQAIFQADAAKIIETIEQALIEQSKATAQRSQAGDDSAELGEVTVKYAAEVLGLSEVRIRRMVKEGKFAYSSRSHIYRADFEAELSRRADLKAGIATEEA